MPDQAVNLVTPAGRTISVPASEVEERLAQGYRRESAPEADVRADERLEKERYDTPAGAFTAAVTSGLSGLTGGLFDKYVEAVGGEDAVEDLAKIQKHAPVASTGGRVAGHILGPGKFATAAKGRILAKGADRAARKVAAHTVEGALDAGLYEAGGVVSQSALGDDPLTLEKLATGFGTGVLVGAPLGGGIGAIGHKVGTIRKRRAAQANPLLHSRTPEAKAVAGHLGKEFKRVDEQLDDKFWADAQAYHGQQVMRDMGAGRRAGQGAETVADDSAAMNAALARDGSPPPVQAVDPKATTPGKRVAKGSDPNATNPGKRFAKGTPQPEPPPGPQLVNRQLNIESDAVAAREIGALRKQIDDVRGRLVKRLGPDLEIHLPSLVKQPPKQIVALGQDMDEYLGLVQQAGAIARRNPAEHLTNADDLLQGATFGLDNAEEAVSALRNLKSDPEALPGMLGIRPDQMPKSAVSDAVLQVYSLARLAESTSAKRAVGLVDEARSNFSALTSGMTGGLLSRSVRRVLAVPEVAMMSAMSIVGKASGRIADAALAVAQPATKHGRRPAVLGASEVLRQVRFSNQEDKSEKNLAKRRIAELDELMSNKQHLDRVIEDRLAPLRAHNLDAGFAVQEQLRKRLEFYHATAPRGPMSNPAVKSRWQPSAAEAHEWAIKIRAGENPMSILDDIVSGKRVSPMAVETVKLLWPELYAEMQQQVVKNVTELQAELPYERRLQLGIMFDVAVDPSTEPTFIHAMQEEYAAQHAPENDPGVNKLGGTPKPQPATKGQSLEAR